MLTASNSLTNTSMNGNDIEHESSEDESEDQDSEDESQERSHRVHAPLEGFVTVINPFSTNVPLMDKPGCWFFLAKCLKNTCGRVTL